MSPQLLVSPRVCPHCGFSHLRRSTAHSLVERVQGWWTRTAWFMCETCQSRHRISDTWDPDAAFPGLPPLRLARELDMETLQQRDEESVIDLVLSRRQELVDAIRVWLDDSRPAPVGWLRVTSVASARRLLQAGVVQEISLDYDLGWCPECLHQGEHLKHSDRRHCPHTPTGYDLVIWMTETRYWPKLPPTVHSGNLDGAARMLGLVARQWRGTTLLTARANGAPSTSTDVQAGVAAPLDLSPSAVATLTMCPNCHGPHVQRAHRHSNFDRMRSLMTRRRPIRCAACGWSKWVQDPILVRFSANTVSPASAIEMDRLEEMEPEGQNEPRERL